MRTLTSKVWICVLMGWLSVVSAYGQITDSATLPVLQKDVADQTARLVAISGVQIVEAEQMEDLARFTEEWVEMNEAVQNGLRTFGQNGWEDGPQSTVDAAFEDFWLVKGLWKQIRQMVSLYGDYLSGFEHMDFAVNALRTETMDVFITQGYNTIGVFNNMMGIIKDRTSAHPQMTIRQCFTKGEDMKRQGTSINNALKWQLRRVHDYSLMNNTLDPFKGRDIPTKGNNDFDPAKANRM